MVNVRKSKGPGGRPAKIVVPDQIIDQVTNLVLAHIARFWRPGGGFICTKHFHVAEIAIYLHVRKLFRLAELVILRKW